MTNIGDSRKILLGSNMSKPVDCCSSKNVERGFSQACSGASKSLNISVAKHPSKYFGILPKEHWSDTDARGRNTPFLHDMRYTSYGRHFTKSEKLQEVVDRLHNYVLDGDTIVDFCCGSNDDFSLLMKKKLNEMGKCCSFRKNDIIQPKNDFCLEKRDWMSLTPKELPAGSKLIMWLNPPFEVKASMANKFINMALEFNPKLLILFVREETKRLDDNYGYDLIWEERKIFSGKSFYLPGSTDVCNKQIEQWNNSPPPLYLWSRSDWSNTHRNIATQHGHVFMVQGEANEHYDTGLSTFSNYLMEDSHGCYDEDYADIMPENVDIAGILDDISDLEYSNESEPDEVRGNKRKYNVSPEDTEPEPSGVESSIPVKKMVNHLFYEASSSKLSSVIMKPQMIRTTQGLMNWSQPVPAGSSSASGGGSQLVQLLETLISTPISTALQQMK